MKWCTLLWLCLTFIAGFFFSFFYFFSQEAVLFFSHLASFHHSFSQDWRISTEAEACHTFPDLRPEDDMIEMISCSVSTHLAALHFVPVLSSGIYKVDSLQAGALSYVWISTNTDTCTQAYMPLRYAHHIQAARINTFCISVSSCIHTLTNNSMGASVMPLNARYYSRCVISANALRLWDKWGLKN